VLNGVFLRKKKRCGKNFAKPVAVKRTDVVCFYFQLMQNIKVEKSGREPLGRQIQEESPGAFLTVEIK